LALLVNREFRWARLARTIAMLPYLIPTAVLGFVAFWMANSQSGTREKTGRIAQKLQQFTAC
jgi:multiple sugar transport system permease protein